MTEPFENQPATGADPTRPAPGLGPHEQDPMVAAESEPPTAGPSPPTTGPSPPATNLGRVWISIGVATVLLILLIIFIAENSRAVTISFLGANGHISLALALLIAAVVGATVTLLAGTARILQLRLHIRRGSRAGVKSRDPRPLPR